MSREAMEAVIHHSQFRSPDTFSEYHALLCIAEHATPDGHVGVKGEPKKCPSLAKIAAAAGMHRNSAGALLDRLKAAGEIDYQSYGTHGRAIHYTFQILLPIDQTPKGDATNKSTTNSTISTTPQRGDVQLLQVQIDELKAQNAQLNAQLAQINAQLAQIISTISTMPSGAIVHETINNKNHIETSRETNSAREALPTSPPESLNELPPDPWEQEQTEDDIPFEEPGLFETWQAAHALVAWWCRLLWVQPPRVFDNQELNDRTYQDYHYPAARLIAYLDGDIEQAQQLLEVKRAEMVAAGYPPRRLEPVVKQIKDDFDRLEATPTSQPATDVAPELVLIETQGGYKW